MTPHAYTPTSPPLPETADELRARIPGWGADLDPADRPAVPRLQLDPGRSGAHWEVPDQQPERWPRERSIEHAMLTPVFGTSCPPKGVSGLIRRQAYARFSEARAAHWLLLVAADRVDTVGSTLGSWVTRRPENPLVGTGIRTELSHHGWSSRVGRDRADVGHHLLDPVVVAGPWLVGGTAVVALARAARRRRRSS
ncbi:hypothetical protein [Nocardioides sp. URHA0020]|uniref:hypothetical protein n=1 Tax=Nocardioides sp. URHA0020 TaxID=1380392 RepID=UPI00055E13F5|nr:hypothetical protein [Nocardioides sp. URHA0020]